MYLKRLTLKGFKSFPIKTDIFFEKGVTAVVGPNGSGKSNISDAIRWVLGEQSIKSLRGEKMEDVIFSGTDAKNEMNFCEVSITLDNSEGIIDGEDEVIVKRRAYRNGDSEFFINNKRCRLKDVRETLMDTGIGKDGYSIIEQGKVEELLSNNPQNKRKIFDEACGIAKYRYKKNEAEKNLKKSSENLDRIVDIFLEIESQLKPLERQQHKAKKYIVLSEDLKKLEINDILIKYSNFENERVELTEKINDLESEISLLENEKVQIESNIDDVRLKIDIVETSIDNINNQLASVSESINNNNTEIKLTSEKIKNKEIEIDRKKSELKLLSDKIEVDNDELKKADKRVDENSYIIETLQSELEDIFDKKRISENTVNEIKKSIDDKKNFSLQLLEEKQSITQNFATVQANIDNMNIRIEELKKDNSNIEKEISETEKEISQKNNLVQKISEDILKYKKSIEEIDTEIDLKIKQEKTLNDKLNRINLEKGSSSSKMNAYIDMENHHEGFNRGVKEILKNKNIQGIYGALGELISVSEKYEKAVEAALGASIQNVVVDNESTAKTSINHLKKNNFGRVTFLPLSVMKGNKININISAYKNKPIGVCSELIEFENRYKGIIDNILGKVIVIEDIDKAINFAKESGHRYRIVTLEGDIINPGGSMTGGSLKSSGSILSRKRIIQELESKIFECNTTIEKTSLDIESLKRELNNLKIKKEKLVESLNSEEQNMITTNTEIRLVEDRVKNKLSSINDNSKEIEIINEKIETLTISYEELEKTIEKISIENDDNISSTSNLETQLLEANKKLEELVKVFNEKNLVLERHKQVFELGINELKRIEFNINSSMSEKNIIEQSLIDLDKEINSLDELFENLGEQLKVDQSEHDDLIEKLSDKKLEKDELKVDFEEMNVELRQKSRAYTDAKEDRFKYDSKLDRVKYNHELMLETLNEKYELNYEGALEFKDESMIIDYEKIEKLKKSIKALGNVNLDSIDEYEDVKNRYEYYKTQKEDLETSIISINKLIEDLTENMKVEFLEKFNIINENFKEVYVKLFGGGKANLSITDEDNILGCDIEITAQPPGKKMKNLSLLSGGEKALTAICILFGILISKPTPFCILDEIEAPLDDVNVYRFGEYLKELSEDTQFIAVTHRRGTMEVADYIYGVTMQEKGVSSILSIKLNEATEMVEQ